MPAHPHEVESRPLLGKRILIVRAAGQSAVLARRLQLLGAELFEAPLIAIAAPPDPERLAEATRRLGDYDVAAFTSENAVAGFFAALEARSLDVVLLTSSSIADGLVDLLGPRAVELLADVFVVSIGPITTATAERRGLTVGLTAAESTVAGLVSALEGHLSKDT